MLKWYNQENDSRRRKSFILNSKIELLLNLSFNIVTCHVQTIVGGKHKDNIHKISGELKNPLI